MSLPAQAFGLVEPVEIAPGSVFMFRGAWALRVARGPTGMFQGFILLTGEHAGRLSTIIPGMAKCVVVLQPFDWFAAVADNATPGSNGLRTATLTLAGDGPVVVCSDMDGYDPEYTAYRTDGSCDENYGQHGASVCFPQWSAELQHPSRPFASLGQLFTVDRRQAEK